MSGKARQGEEGDGKEREGERRLKVERGGVVCRYRNKMKQIHL